MTRTIEERIEEVIDDLPGVADLSVHDFKRAFQRHFCEPWLDKPDGPGWWWQRDDTGFTWSFYLSENAVIRTAKGAVIKWQRVIGPSE